MRNEKVLTQILEVRENSEETLAISFETGGCPAGILFGKDELGDSLRYLKEGRQVIVETKGPLDIAGSEFIALYIPGEEQPFYRS